MGKNLSAPAFVKVARGRLIPYSKKGTIEFRIIYLQRKEVGLLPEGHDQGWSAAHAAQRAAGMEA